MPERSISDLERELQARFNPEKSRKFSSTVDEGVQPSAYVQDLALPDESRGRLPLTKDTYVINENPARVEWEREVRKFLNQLNSDFGHRITAPMVYEWVTGIDLRDLINPQANPQGGGQWGIANVHLRHINWVLKEYFGTAYKTKIAGRPVGKAYTVRPYFRVKDKKPANLTLWPEWEQKTLNP
jgi:hypothetical protein